MLRGLWGSSAFGGSVTQLDSFVAHSAGLPLLEQRIEAALAAARSPWDDDAVLRALIEVARAETSGAALAAPTRRLAASAVHTTRVTSPLPALLFDGTDGALPFKLWLSGDWANGNLEVRNNTPAFWSLWTEQPDGTRLPLHDNGAGVLERGGALLVPGVTARVATGDALLSRHWLTSAMRDLLRVGAQPVVMTGAPSTGFNLVAQQNDETRRQNNIAIVGDLVALVLQAQPRSMGCLESSTSRVFSTEVDTAIRDGSPVDVLSAIRGDWLNVASVALACTASGRVSARYVRFALRQVAWVVRVVEAAGTIDTGLTLAARVRFLTAHAGREVRHGVCLGVVAPGRYGVVSCSARLRAGPFMDAAPWRATQAVSQVTLLPGAVLPLPVQARNSAGDLTPLPGALDYTVTGSAVRVVPDEFGSARIEAFTEGTAAITITDLATGARDELVLQVRQPSLEPDSTAVVPGGTVSVRLVSALSTDTVFANASGLTYESDDPQRLARIPLFGNESAAYFLAATNAAEGPVTIRARDPVGRVVASVQVRIASHTIAPMWRSWLLPHQRTANYGCPITEQLSADGILTITGWPQNATCTQGTALAIHDLKVGFHRVVYLPNETVLRVFSNLDNIAGPSSWSYNSASPPLLAESHRIFTAPADRVAEFFLRLQQRPVQCTEATSGARFTGTLRLEGSQVQLLEATGATRPLGPLPTATTTTPLVEEYLLNSGATPTFSSTTITDTNVERRAGTMLVVTQAHSEIRWLGVNGFATLTCTTSFS